MKLRTGSFCQSRSGHVFGPLEVVNEAYAQLSVATVHITWHATGGYNYADMRDEHPLDLIHEVRVTDVKQRGKKNG